LARAGRQRRHEESRQAYARACQCRVGEEIGSLQAEITLLEDGVEELARGITRATRRLSEMPDGDSRGQRPGTADPTDLAALPEVADLRWQPRGLSVVTHPIRVEHEGRRYALGSFELELAFDGGVRITNRTGRVGADDHPHVHKGRPRLCNVREGVAKLVGEGQLAQAVEVLIDFLKTVRPADWRTPIWAWPEARDEAAHGASAAA
jgi:hypothetical protein